MLDKLRELYAKKFGGVPFVGVNPSIPVQPGATPVKPPASSVPSSNPVEVSPPSPGSPSMPVQPVAAPKPVNDIQPTIQMPTAQQLGIRPDQQALSQFNVLGAPMYTPQGDLRITPQQLERYLRNPFLNDFPWGE